jgi:hypothetical protein
MIVPFSCSGAVHPLHASTVASTVPKLKKCAGTTTSHFPIFAAQLRSADEW